MQQLSLRIPLSRGHQRVDYFDICHLSFSFALHYAKSWTMLLPLFKPYFTALFHHRFFFLFFLPLCCQVRLNYCYWVLVFCWISWEGKEREQRLEQHGDRTEWGPKRPGGGRRGPDWVGQRRERAMRQHEIYDTIAIHTSQRGGLGKE